MAHPLVNLMALTERLAKAIEQVIATWLLAGSVRPDEQPDYKLACEAHSEAVAELANASFGAEKAVADALREIPDGATEEAFRVVLLHRAPRFFVRIAAEAPPLRAGRSGR